MEGEAKLARGLAALRVMLVPHAVLSAGGAGADLFRGHELCAFCHSAASNLSS